MKKAKFVLGALLATASPVAIVLVGATLLPSVAVAQQKVSASVGKHLKTAQDAIKARRWDQALAAIKQAQGVQPQTAYDAYKTNELLWYVYLQQGRNNDAARVLEQQMASGMMGGGERVQRTKTLAQLYARGGNHGKAVQYANQYLKSAPGDREMQLLIAQSYYQQKDYKNAIAAAEKLTKSGQPSEDVLQLLLRCNYELGDKAGTARTLEQLLKYYPKPETWRSLINTYLSQTKHDHELVSLYRLAEDTGSLTKARDYTDMAQILVTAGSSIEAQRIMEKGLADNLFEGEDKARAQRTLDAAKRRADADRKTLATLDRTVASARSGEELYSAGKLYFSAGDYAKAADALQKAIAKGGVSDLDDAHMLAGIALARSGRNADAQKQFDAIKDPKFAEIGKLWKIRARA